MDTPMVPSSSSSSSPYLTKIMKNTNNRGDPVERIHTLLSQLDTAVESLSPGTDRIRTYPDSSPSRPSSAAVAESSMISPPSVSMPRYSYGASEITHARSPNLSTTTTNTLSDLDVRLYENTVPATVHRLPSTPPLVPPRSAYLSSPSSSSYPVSAMDKNAQITSVMESAVRIAESAALVVEANVRETKALLESTSGSRPSSIVRSSHHGPIVVSRSAATTMIDPVKSSSSSSRPRSSSTSHHHQPSSTTRPKDSLPQSTNTKDKSSSARPTITTSSFAETVPTTTRTKTASNHRHRSSSTDKLRTVSSKTHHHHPPLPSEDSTEKETKATIALAQKISKYEEKTINRATHAALHWVFQRIVKQIPPRLDQLIPIHVENRTVEIATFTLLRWIHLTWSIYRTSIKPIWIQHEQYVKAKTMSLTDRLYQGLPAATTLSANGSRRASVMSVSSRRSSIEYNYSSSVTHRYGNDVTDTGNHNDTNDFWYSDSGYQKALGLGKEEFFGLPIPRPTRYFHITVPNADHGMLRLILRGWKNWNSRYQRLRQRSIHKQQHALFSQWRFFVLQQQTLRAKAEIIASLHARSTARRALQAWIQARKFAIQNRLQQKLLQGLEHLDRLQTQRFVRTILSRWKQWSYRNQQAKAFSLRVQQKRVHGLLDRWLIRSKESLRTHALIQENRERLRVRRLTKIFHAWNGYTNRKARLHALVSTHQPVFAQRKLVYYLRSRWQQNVRARKQQKLVLAKAIAVWRNDRLGYVFLAWKRKAYGRRARLQAAATVAQRHRQRQLRNAVRVWKKDANFSHHCKKIVLMWTKTSSDRVLNQLFSGWRKWAHQRRLRHDQLDQRTQSFQVWRQRRALQRWRIFNQQQKSFADIRRRMQRYYAQRAVRTWYHVYRQILQQRSQASDALRSRARRLLQVWKTFAHTSQHNKRIMLNAIHRFQHSRVLAIINHWQRWTEARLLHRASLTHRDNSLVRNTFQRWKRYVTTCQMNRSRGYAAAAKMEQFCLRLAIIRWREQAQYAQKCRLALHNFLSLSRQGTLLNRFRSWSVYAAKRRAWRTLRSTLTTTLQQRKLSMVLGQWKERAQEWKEKDRKNTKAIQRITHRRLSHAFGALKAYAHQHRTWRLHRDEALQTYHQKKITQQLKLWHEFTRTRVHHRSIVQRMETQRNERNRTRMFTAWSIHIQERKVRKERAAKAIVTMDTYRNHLSLRTWCKRTQIRIHRRKKIEEMVLRRIGKVFTAWKNRTLRTRSLHEATKTFHEKRFRSNLQLWLRRSHESSLIRKTYTLAFTHHNTSVLSNCFDAWKQHTQKHAVCRRLKTIVAPRVRKLVETNYKRQFFIRYRMFAELEALRRRAQDAYERTLRKKAFREWYRRAQEKRTFREHTMVAKARLDQLHFRHLLHWWLKWSQQERRVREFRNQTEAKKLEEWKKKVFHQWAYYVIRKRHLQSLVNDLRTEKLIYSTIATVKLWQEFTVRRVYAKNIITRATESILNRKVQLALQHWRASTEAVVEKQREKVRLAHERANHRRGVLVFRHFRLFLMIRKASRLALKDVILRLSFKQWTHNTARINQQAEGLYRCYIMAEKVAKQEAVRQWRQYLHDMQQERMIQLRMSRAAAICHKFCVQSILRRWKSYSQRQRQGKKTNGSTHPPDHGGRKRSIVDNDDKPAPQLRQHGLINNQLAQLGVL